MKKRFLSGFLPLLVLLGFASQALAAGTPAGTPIKNQAYVDYNDANGNPLSRVFSNTVTTTVSQVAGVELQPPNSTVVGANGETVYFAVGVVNTGNGDDVYDFAIDPPTGWEPDSVTFYHDVDGSGTLTAGDTEIVPVGNVYTTGTIPADGVYPIIVEMVIPDAATAPDGSTSVSTGTVTSQFDNGVSAPGSFTVVVSTAIITGAKTFAPANPEPGETVTYTITLANSGSSAGTTALLNDPIPAGMTFVDGSITLQIGSGEVNSLTNDSGDDAGDFDITVPNGVYVDIGTIDASGGANDQAVVTFQATVDSGLTAGTTVTNQATFEYDSDGNGINDVTATSNGATFTIANVPSVLLTPSSTSATGDPGDAVTYAITVDNNGNTADVIDLTLSSTEGWPWVLWFDANGDGIPGNDGDFLLTDTDGDGDIDTGSLPQGGSAAILATTVIPAGTSNGTTDTLIVTGASSVDTNVTDTTGNLVTTVTAPVLAIAKSVDPAGNQAPGTTLTYTIEVTNNGTGTATSVIITDLIPAFTTYVDDSIRIGSTPADLLLPAAVKTDDVDGDGAEFDSGSNAVIAGGASKTLSAGGTFFLRFQVTID